MVPGAAWWAARWQGLWSQNQPMGAVFALLYRYSLGNIYYRVYIGGSKTEVTMEVRVFRNQALWALALCLGARAAHATSYTIEDLGALGSAGGSNGYAVNASGQVAGATSVLPSGMHAFLYDSLMTDLGTLGTGRQSYGFS